MFFLYLAIIVFVLDRITKIIVTKILSSNESLPVIHRIFSITLVKNTGSAFGLLPQATKFFIWFSILAIIIIIIFLFHLKKKDFFVKFSLALIMGGALGNLFDRLAFGYVIDFLDFKIWPVFNLADLFISSGCLLLLFKMVFPCRKQTVR